MAWKPDPFQGRFIMEGSKMLFSRRTPRRARSKCSRCKCGSRFGWFSPTAVTAFFGLIGAAGSHLPVTSLPSASAEPQKVQPAGMIAPATTPEMPLDQPLRLLAAAQQTYNQVQTYECLLISQERVNGNLLPEKVMQMTFRKNPLSVYMKWLAPKEDVGQEVCYVAGRNQNKMRVLSPKAKWLGWLSIDVNDPQVMQHSRHKITEAGFGNWLERYAVSWTAERTMGKTQVQVAEYDYNKRRCTRVETIHTVRERTFYCYRNVLYFDNETHLPIRMECYDWPRQGGPPEGELLECFSYVNINFNVAVPEAVFTH